MRKLDLGWELRSAQHGFSKALGFRCLVKAWAVPAEIYQMLPTCIHSEARFLGSICHFGLNLAAVRGTTFLRWVVFHVISTNLTDEPYPVSTY